MSARSSAAAHPSTLRDAPVREVRATPALPAHGSWHGRLAALALFFGLLACNAYFFPRWADWNQNSRFDLVLAIVNDGSVVIDKYVANTGDYANFRGHYYSDKAPGMALLGVPAYAAFRAVMPQSTGAALSRTAGGAGLAGTLREGGSGLADGKVEYFVALAATTLLTVAVPSAVLGVIFYAVAGTFGLGVPARLAATLAYALATNAFAYSNAFVGHQTSAFLLFAAAAMLFAMRRGAIHQRWLPAAGFLIGYAAITEYPTVLIGGVLGLYAAYALGRPIGVVLRLAAGAVPALAALVAYDFAAFGTPLPVGYFHSALWSDVHQSGLISVTHPQADALWGITFGAHRGLFFLSPYLLFAVPGFISLWREPARRPEAAVLLMATVSFLLFNGSSAMWHGGFAVGPRYLLPSLPFLALAAGVGLARAWRLPSVRPLVVLSVAWSVFVVWSETIAGQSFPDYTPNPLFDFSLPRLAVGDIARNAGMVLGLRSWSSLAPLAVLGLAALAVGAALVRSNGADAWRSRRPSAWGALRTAPQRVRL